MPLKQNQKSGSRTMQSLLSNPQLFEIHHSLNLSFYYLWKKCLLKASCDASNDAGFAWIVKGFGLHKRLPSSYAGLLAFGKEGKRLRRAWELKIDSSPPLPCHSNRPTCSSLVWSDPFWSGSKHEERSHCPSSSLLYMEMNFSTIKTYLHLLFQCAESFFTFCTIIL